MGRTIRAADVSVGRHIEVSLCNQTLMVREEQTVIAEFLVSTSAWGPGETAGSFATPRGRHVIRAKIGAESPAGSVFVRRRCTGEIYTGELGHRFPERDWILSRILWLGGLEPGRNRFGAVDTQRRFIYIHGTPDSEPMGVPRSHGCIRMRNMDVIELFAMVDVGTTSEIMAWRSK